MLNLLIIDKDVNNSKLLLNYISENSCQVRVHSLASNLSEGIKILNTGLIDITLINLDDDINSIVTNLHTISSSYFEKYKKSVLLLSRNIDNVAPDSYIYECISSEEDISVIFLKISEIVKSKISQFNNSILLSKINKELEYIGYNLSYYGARYLAESIALIYNNYDSSENLNKNIYPVIAKKYNKSQVLIKANIFQAIGQMYRTIDKDKLSTYFGYSLLDKPTTKEIIFTILQKIS